MNNIQSRNHCFKMTLQHEQTVVVQQYNDMIIRIKKMEEIPLEKDYKPAM
jgi:hypothetical protein